MDKLLFYIYLHLYPYNSHAITVVLSCVGNCLPIMSDFCEYPMSLGQIVIPRCTSGGFFFVGILVTHMTDVLKDREGANCVSKISLVRKKETSLLP